MDELLTVDEVAAYLRVSRSTVWRWCQARKVPAFKIGREWRISWPVLEELVAAQQTTVAAQQDAIAAQQRAATPEADNGPPAASLPASG